MVPSATRKLAPGDISEVLPTGNAALIVHVDYRSAGDEKGIEDAKKFIGSRIADYHSYLTFMGWLAERRQAAGLKDEPEK